MYENKMGNGLAVLGGTALMAFGIQCFLEPAKIVAGGITGIGIILSSLCQARFGVALPLWLANAALNLPLFLIAWKTEGSHFIGKTVVTSFIFSLMLFLVQGISFYMGDLILSSVYGGALVGVGLGLVLKSGATTGGVDLAAAVLHKIWPRPSLSGKIFIMDAAIILAGMFIFGGMSGLYAILSVFITERCVGWILVGTDTAQGAIVISDKAAELSETLSQRFGRDITAFCQKEGQAEGEREIMFCVFSQKEIQAVKSIIINFDRNALFFVTDIREILAVNRISK